MPARFVKLVSGHLACPLTTIINNCISKLYFPRAWKLARISPIPKVYTPVTEDDLRPVSILPVLSKVFEKLVASQMTDFCSRESLLRDTISSFRKGHSTSTVLLGIRDDLLSAMKRREVTLMVLADFSKAFDTVCFKTVITKLHHLGFSKNVQIDDRKSSPVFSEFGISRALSLDRCCSISASRIFKIFFHLQLKVSSMPTTQQYTLAVLHRRLHLKRKA